MIHLHNYESINESKDMDTIKKWYWIMLKRMANLNGKNYKA